MQRAGGTARREGVAQCRSADRTHGKDTSMCHAGEAATTEMAAGEMAATVAANGMWPPP